MKAIVQGNFMECGKGYDKKDKDTGKVVEHIEDILVYSSGSTVKISNIDGSQFEKFQEVSILCNITQGTYGLNVSAVI